MRTFPGENPFVGGVGAENTLRKNIHTSFLPDIHHDKACKTDVGMSGNRSQQIEESFGLEREIVWRKMYGRFCMLLGLHLLMQISFHLVFYHLYFMSKNCNKLNRS
jgi:hypothetical protein